MKTFKGLLYVKHGWVGSKSEGPDYYLQTRKEDFLLKYHDRQHWEPDYHLEFYCRKMVEVNGEITGESEGMKLIQVKSIGEINTLFIPATDDS